jgi:hypothetical protein
MNEEQEKKKTQQSEQSSLSAGGTSTPAMKKRKDSQAVPGLDTSHNTTSFDAVLSPFSVSIFSYFPYFEGRMDAWCARSICGFVVVERNGRIFFNRKRVG